jgi:hypothetical protein
MSFELTNTQREYLGLDPIENHWEKVPFKGDYHRPDSYLYFDGEIIKRHIISTEDKYSELQHDDLTQDQTMLLPKTSGGKTKKLTASVLEQRQPNGVYFTADNYGNLLIGNYNTQTTFYSTRWERFNITEKKSIPQTIEDFIVQSPSNHLAEIRNFKIAKRKNIKFRSGDYFCFKLNRTLYGFGRVLLNIHALRKKGLISSEHGFNLIMGQPVSIQLFAYASPDKYIDVPLLEKQNTLPSDTMMDNLLFYGEYEIIGHSDLKEEDFEFPISYGKSIDQRQVVFLQWGIIHRELPRSEFNKFLIGDNTFVPVDSPSRKIQNPFGYYSIGFRPHYDTIDVLKAVENNGLFSYETQPNYKSEFDLRNPKNKAIRNEILLAFGLDPDRNYAENCKLAGVGKVTDVIKQL